MESLLDKSDKGVLIQLKGRFDTLAAPEFEFQGLHIFAGSQNLQAEALVDAHNKTFALAGRLANATTLPVQTVNIGGGLGIPYFPGEVALDAGPVADNLVRLLDNRPAALGEAEIVMEHGGHRYQFVSEPSRARFEEDPERYSIQNESCLVVPGAPLDPSLFSVHEGRIYAFASSNCVGDFEASPEVYLPESSTQKGGR